MYDYVLFVTNMQEKINLIEKIYNKNTSHSIMAGKKSFIIYLIIHLFKYFPMTHKYFFFVYIF